MNCGRELLQVIVVWGVIVSKARATVKVLPKVLWGSEMGLREGMGIRTEQPAPNSLGQERTSYFTMFHIWGTKRNSIAPAQPLSTEIQAFP